jgi:Uma2 family endonuclease
MGQALEKQYYTQAEYLAIERAASFKSEYYNGEIFMMAGASLPHNRICQNVSGEVYTFLKKKNCKSFSNDLRLHIPKNSLYTYPDIVIVCGKIETLDDEKDTILNPSVIIEVLSKSTADYDRGGKFVLYRQIPTLKEYILIDSRTVTAEVWRKNESGFWFLQKETTNLTDQIIIDTIDFTLRLEDIYEGVNFI